MTDGAGATYEGLSQRGLLAISLLGIEDWRRAHDLRDPNLDALVHHLWEWLAVGPASFEDWYAWESPALEFALDPATPFPPAMAAHWQAAGATGTQARRLLGPLVDLTEAHLFGSIDRAQLLDQFKALRRELAADGVFLRPPSAFADAPFDDAHGWGRRLSPEELHAWRSR